ncbi:SpoIIE family protein phosphatase [Kitasatospora sp. NPDC087315]|uniref:SpoIIE family protein phosphatase n=1 Tax=Kitasatospora sp. NPDC087315 TaxID=3364069 RepID=UPI00381D9F03
MRPLDRPEPVRGRRTGIPLGVDPDLHRPDHTRPPPAGATVVLFTDGLVEDPARPIDEGLDALAVLAAAHATLPLDDLVHVLSDHHPSDGHHAGDQLRTDWD